MRYRNVDRSTFDIASGQMVPAGDFVELDAKPKPAPKDLDDAARAVFEEAALLSSVTHPHNASLIADGRLIEAPQPGKEPKS